MVFAVGRIKQNEKRREGSEIKLNLQLLIWYFFGLLKVIYFVGQVLIVGITGPQISKTPTHQSNNVSLITINIMLDWIRQRKG